MVVYGGTNECWLLSATRGNVDNANGTGRRYPCVASSYARRKMRAAVTNWGLLYSVSTNRLSIFAGDNAPICCNLLNDVWDLPNANGIGGGGGTCLPPPAGLVSWWSGDKTANDVQGTNNGILLNGASFRPGMVGPGFRFDGVDDYVGFPMRLVESGHG